MQTDDTNNQLNEKTEKEWEWTWKNLFDKEFKEKLKAKLHWFPRVIRISVILAVFLHFFAFGAVPSESMLPTLQVKDYVLYKKTSTFVRGDIVLFKHPQTDELYVKRVIGLPGDEVEVKEGLVYVNGNPLKEAYLLEPPMYVYQKVKVPPNEFFLLGDNRNNSEDSTHFGFVQSDRLKGKAIAVVLPFSRIHLLFYVQCSYEVKSIRKSPMTNGIKAIIRHKNTKQLLTKSVDYSIINV